MNDIKITRGCIYPPKGESSPYTPLFHSHTVGPGRGVKREVAHSLFELSMLESFGCCGGLPSNVQECYWDVCQMSVMGLCYHLSVNLC